VHYAGALGFGLAFGLALAWLLAAYEAASQSVRHVWLAFKPTYRQIEKQN